MPSTIKAMLSLAASFFFASNILAQTHYPLTIIDGSGQPVTIDQQPEKISSKTLFTDEVLFELTDSAHITSLTNLAADPHYSNIADRLDDKIARLDLNVETILMNEPDIVFVANWSEADKVKQLRASGITVYLVNTPLTLEAIEIEIRTIGQILNLSDSANTLIENMNTTIRSLNDLKAQVQNQQWVALDYNSWGTSSGKNTTWQAVLDASGLINGAAPFEQGNFGQVGLSKELIVAINPDILFLPSWTYGGDDQAANFYIQVINDPALRNVKAIQNQRIYQIPEGLRGTYSQYIAETISYVTTAVYQDINPKDAMHE